MKTTHPEYQSVLAFVEFLMDDDRTTFLPGDAQRIAENTGVTVAEVLAELRSYGLTVTLNHRPEVRGFTSPLHGSNRFAGNCGGSGWEQIAGFAGRAG